MASMHAASAPVREARTPAGDPAWLVQAQYKAEVDKAQTEPAQRQTELRQQESVSEVVKPAARGLSGANVSVLNGTDGLGELTSGLVSQRLRIFDSVRQNLGNDAPGTAPAVRHEGDR